MIFYMLEERIPTAEEFASEDWLDEFDDATVEGVLTALGLLLARDRKESLSHDRNGWFAHEAGSEQCLALGHTLIPDEEDELGDDERWDPVVDHDYGWDGDVLCLGTRFGVACTGCLGGDCEARRLDVHLWSLPGVRVDG